MGPKMSPQGQRFLILPSFW